MCLNGSFQDENRQLVERLIKYKAKDAEKLNEENESFLKYVQFTKSYQNRIQSQVIVVKLRR